jgi:hypothetical protein
MDWWKKHTDTIIVLGGILSAVIWMNGKFTDVHTRLNEIEKDIVMVKTVMIMQKIMPTELAAKEKEYLHEFPTK